MSIVQHVETSERLGYEDLDWDLAREVGLTARERSIVQFFADVEGQIGFYYLELAGLEVARDPELSAFLVTWNFEKYFHAHALTTLLRACGVDIADVTERRTQVRGTARPRAKLEDLGQSMMAALLPRQFVALWMLWGALQEALTTKGYERIVATTANPVLAELCRRIAKQERRHFAFYFQQARARLAGDPGAQRLCRLVAKRFYTPVGSGVKRDTEVAQLVAELFPRAELFVLMSSIEHRIQELPGMSSFTACTTWAANVQPLLAPQMRAQSEVATRM